jgi:outer membrane receptor for ferrienterochelin and colicin
MKKYTILVFLISLSFIVQLWAGTTGKLAGIVIDKENQEALIGVNVFLEGTMLGATTDMEGNYFILNIPPGKYTLIVQYVGYQEVRMKNVSISIDLTTTRNFELPEAALELEEAIIVEGRREFIQKDMTSSQASISSEEIENMPVVELSDVLQLQAGVTRDATGDFHIRGGRTSEIAYWVNGVSITDAYDNSQGIEIDNSSVQELQVISGTFNAEYGNAMSGIINTVTKEGGNDLHGNVKVYSGDHISNFTDYFPHIDNVDPFSSYNFQGGLDGPIPFTNKKVLFFITGRYNYSDGYLYGERRYKPTGESDDNEIVPMNWSKKYNGQAKITYWVLPTLKFNAEILASKRDYQDYSHEYRWNPDGNVYKFAKSYNYWLSMTHTLSANTFYTVNASFFFKNFNEYLYEDPTDSRYLHPDSLSDNVFLSFRTKGTNLHRFFRETLTWSYKADLTNQTSKNHLITTGIEYKTHRLKLDDYDLEPKMINNIPVSPFKSAIPGLDSPNRTKYERKPYEFSGYIQDKIELKSVIINIGLRLDYFNSKSDILVDPRDPNINNPLRPELDSLSLAERESYYYKEADPKWQLSPRFGIAYPISESGVIHFSYGHFLQIPSFQYLYNRGGYQVPQTGSKHGVYGNPDLEPQRTVMYEIGLQQEISNDFKIDVTGFYRDVRDWITSSAFIETYIEGNTYCKYINKDYSNIRGVTLALKKRYSDSYSFDISYTYQLAEGSNSSPDDEFEALRGNSEPTLYLLPLDWDQRHLFNISIYVGGESWGSSLISRYGTGLPYTPTITQYISDRGISSGLPGNSRRKPNQFILDFKLNRSFNIAGFNFLAFLRVFNLLDSKIVVNVFGDTGKADFTTEYQNLTDDDPNRPNTIAEYSKYPDHYGEPRRVQLGLELSF